MTLVAFGEVEDNRLYALVDLRFPPQPELEEDRVDHLLNGPFAQDEGLGDSRVVLPLGHLAEHVSLTRSQLVERRLLAPSVFCHQSLHDLRVEDRATSRDGVDRGNELIEIVAEGSGSATAGADLTPMRDRLEALGGRLTIESELGHTGITGSLPSPG